VTLKRQTFALFRWSFGGQLLAAALAYRRPGSRHAVADERVRHLNRARRSYRVIFVGHLVGQRRRWPPDRAGGSPWRVVSGDYAWRRRRRAQLQHVIRCAMFIFIVDRIPEQARPKAPPATPNASQKSSGKQKYGS